MQGQTPLLRYTRPIIPFLADRLARVKPSPTRAMTALATELKAAGRNIVSLSRPPPEGRAASGPELNLLRDAESIVFRGTPKDAEIELIGSSSQLPLIPPAAEFTAENLVQQKSGGYRHRSCPVDVDAQLNTSRICTSHDERALIAACSNGEFGRAAAGSGLFTTSGKTPAKRSVHVDPDALSEPVSGDPTRAATSADDCCRFDPTL